LQALLKRHLALSLIVKKMLLILPILISCFFLFAVPSRAALINISKNGAVTYNVLSAQSPFRDNPESSIASENDRNPAVLGTKISLTKVDDKYFLKVEGDRFGQFEITNYQGDLVEMEKDLPGQKLSLAFGDGKVQIKEQGIVAQTSLSFNIDSASKKLSLETPSGEKFLFLAPKEAVEKIYQEKILDSTEGAITVTDHNNDLLYEVSGQKILNIFNLVQIPIQVKTQISALTGNIVSVEEPSWLKLWRLFFG